MMQAMMLGGDVWYWVAAGVAFLLSMGAQLKLKAAITRWGGVENARGLTGAEAAREMLAREGVTAVIAHAGPTPGAGPGVLRIEPVAGELTDHFDPRDNVIRLSRSSFASRSLVAVGVACHEAGHALQHAKGYAPMKWRSLVIPFATIGSKAGIPLIVLGLVMGSLGLVKAGLVLFAALFAFQLVTLPVEFNASLRSRAALIGNGVLTSEQDVRGVTSVLGAAALTYVAAAAGTLLWLLYFAFRAGLLGGRRRD